MAVIELGLVTGGEPQSGSPGPLLAPGSARRLLALGIAVLCLLAVSASAVPRPHGLALLWSLPLDAADHNYATSADTLYFLRAGDDRALTAYDLRTGAVRWQTATTGDWIWPLSPGSDVVLLPSTPHDTATPYTGADLVALDADTGARLWQQHGDLLETSADLVVLLTWGEGGTGALRAVRLRDGSTAWSRAEPGAPGWTQVLADAGTGRVVTLAGQGRIDVYAFADGRPATSATVPWTTRARDDGDGPDSSLRLVADTLLVQRDDPGRDAQVTAYDAATLTARWRLTLPAYSGLTDCGEMLCVYAGGALAGYDRATGQRRWQLTGSVNAAVLGTGRLLVEDGATNSPERRLLDAGTGRTVVELGEARPVQDPRTGEVTPFFLAPTREPAGLTSISKLDERSGRLVLLGATEGIHDSGCLAERAVLVCPTGSGRLAVIATGAAVP